MIRFRPNSVFLFEALIVCEVGVQLVLSLSCARPLDIVIGQECPPQWAA